MRYKRIKNIIRKALNGVLQKYICVPPIQRDINLDLCNKHQKRVLISYISLGNINFEKVVHPNAYHVNQMIACLIRKGYCIDVCWHNDLNAIKVLSSNDYDTIIGFGQVYKTFCKEKEIKNRICFITENHPDVVSEKYSQREDYFRERHPEISTDLSFQRTDIFDTETFRLSNSGILMTSEYNARNFRQDFERLELIKSNAEYNHDYVLDNEILRSQIQNNRNRFLWFGSSGLIHKGLDILTDAISELPQYELNCFGIQKNEIKLFNKLKSANTNNCGSVYINSDEFITKVVNRHNFMVLLSCSEGMSTAVATCMMHGIIPIVTKECGYSDVPCVVEIEDYRIESIKSILTETSNWSTERILRQRLECYKYAHDNFSIEEFDNNFNRIIDELLNPDSSLCHQE